MVDLAKELITSESEMPNIHRTLQRIGFYAAVEASQQSSTSSGLQRMCRIVSSAFPLKLSTGVAVNANFWPLIQNFYLAWIWTMQYSRFVFFLCFFFFWRCKWQLNSTSCRKSFCAFKLVPLVTSTLLNINTLLLIKIPQSFLLQVTSNKHVNSACWDTGK